MWGKRSVPTNQDACTFACGGCCSSQISSYALHATDTTSSMAATYKMMQLYKGQCLQWSKFKKLKSKHSYPYDQLNLRKAGTQDFDMDSLKSSF
eukprot:g60056.t1